MSQTQTQIDREAVLMAKEVANRISGVNPALTPAERAELAELKEVAV